MNMRDLIPWGRQSSSAPIAYKREEANPLLSVRRDIDRLFEDLFRGTGLGPGRDALDWPRLEVSESNREVLVTAEVPGMNGNDVELLVEDGILTLRGERKTEKEHRDRGYSERFYGRFERRIALPSDIDEDGATADFRDGVITIHLPRSPEAERGKRIPINGGTRH